VVLRFGPRVAAGSSQSSGASDGHQRETKPLRENVQVLNVSKQNRLAGIQRRGGGSVRYLGSDKAAGLDS
jgi:hypothetical protein